MRVASVFLVCIGLVAGFGTGCKKKSGDKPGAVEESEAIGKRAPAPEGQRGYSADVAGLRGLIADLIRAQRKGGTKVAGPMARRLELSDADAWFVRTFGAEGGKRLAAEYALYGHGASSFPRMLQLQGEKAGRTQLVVERIERADDPAATGFQARAIAAMVEATPLYSVRLVKPDSKDGGDGFHLYNFVHDGERFRYVGRLRETDDERRDRSQRDLLEKRLRDVAAAP